jgi:hypothetical protein
MHVLRTPDARFANLADYPLRRITTRSHPIFACITLTMAPGTQHPC